MSLPGPARLTSRAGDSSPVRAAAALELGGKRC